MSETELVLPEELVAAGHKLFAQDCHFVQSASSADSVPFSELPEVAFVGRSNVGKSSLINGLTNRKDMARSSATPGRTRLLNFFALGERLMLVDLPGYGYAKASKSDIKTWDTLMRDYLRGRPQLSRVCLLIDGRHGLKPSDEEMMKLLDETAVSFQVVFTKADKIKHKEQEKLFAQTQAALKKHPAAHPQLVLVSAHKGWQIPELRAILAQLAEQ